MQYLFATLTVVTFFPLVGVFVILFMRPEQKDAIRWTALVTSLVTFVLSLVMLIQFSPSWGLDNPLTVRAPWITIGDQWNIEYHLSVDGISILLILLTTSSPLSPSPPPGRLSKSASKSL